MPYLPYFLFGGFCIALIISNLFFRKRIFRLYGQVSKQGLALKTRHLFSKKTFEHDATSLEPSSANLLRTLRSEMLKALWVLVALLVVMLILSIFILY